MVENKVNTANVLVDILKVRIIDVRMEAKVNLGTIPQNDDDKELAMVHAEAKVQAGVETVDHALG